jgi:hypothetical protein
LALVHQRPSRWLKPRNKPVETGWIGVSTATGRKTAGLFALRESPVNRAEEANPLLLNFSNTIALLGRYISFSIVIFHLPFVVDYILQGE